MSKDQRRSSHPDHHPHGHVDTPEGAAVATRRPTMRRPRTDTRTTERPERYEVYEVGVAAAPRGLGDHSARERPACAATNKNNNPAYTYIQGGWCMLKPT
eukprot:CAMPEP_0119492490 /NCGR_PEP_ID=MMETSP1344-20130328/17026_1 /TAXON_ID=236787 /ORGANISM="Florenciella parvula, Strain CCMP2471" /LENGTH=99 /DNA_ID=CAMNT_0007527825 /DNA_START=212 /DNA_END=507 /DNA_ORIENTATION=-